MLPNETTLQVLHFADYKSLVLAKLSGRRFLRLAMRYAAELARHRRFRVTFRTTYISYIDVELGERAKRIRYDPADQPSFAAACRELDAVIGPHAVANLIIFENALSMPAIAAVFEAAPALKYAEDVDLYWPGDSTTDTDPEAFLHNFAGMKALRLSLNYDTFRQLSWTFLRRESARELRLIKVSKCYSAPTGSMNGSVEDLVRYCVTLPHVQGGVPLELDFSNNHFSAAFGLRIIELLRDAGREVTFRMGARQDDGDLIRNTVGALITYSIDADNDITRYASDKSGIVVEVKGRERAMFYDSREGPCSVVIRRTAEVPRKKPRTSEQAVPTMPLVE